MDLGLAGSVAVVVGGAGAIGHAVARGFAAEGARVAIADVDAGVDAAASKLAAGGETQAAGFLCDVTDLEAVKRLAGDVVGRFGGVDHVVHAAAIGSGKFGYPFLNLDPRDWARVLEVNIAGAVNVAHAFAPGLVQAKGGTITFIASVAGQMGSQTDPPYSASKAALINFAQCAAKDLAPHEVRVNSVCPGMVKTELNRAVWAAWNARQPATKRRSYEDWAGEKVRQVVPLGRWQEPEDVADMVLFLASKRARNVTGQTINVDGGYVMHW
jgi:NAD(P)-dependent dehydrogenase (short-subunit alcohol dehydrogenase family)